MLVKNILELELKELNKRIKFNKQIIDYLLSPKIIFNNKFKLIAVINTPTYNHYNSVIIELSEKYKNLKLNKDYLYDDFSNNNNEIINIKNLKNTLDLINPYIGLYAKVKYNYIKKCIKNIIKY